MWNAVEVLVQVVMTSRCKCICAQHQHYRLGQDKCFAYRDSGGEDYCEKRVQANLGVKIFSGKCKIFPCVIFFPLVMLKIIIFSVVNKVVLEVKLDIRDPPTY